MPFAESLRSLSASSGSGIDIVNSIAVFMGGDALFIRSDTELKTSSIASNCLWGFSRLMEGRDTLGALSESTLQRLNDLASDARPNMTEAPSKTFYASAKGLRRLSEGSACVDSGVPVIWASKLDLFGKTRSKRLTRILESRGNTQAINALLTRRRLARLAGAAAREF
ncbi:hypothetical protein MASR2M48_29400 [Spirochaetota bacterium]